MRSDRPAPRSSHIIHWLIVLGLLVGSSPLASLRAQGFDPEAATSGVLAANDDAASGRWQVRSMLQDADLIGAAISHIAFAADGTAWLSTDRGLIRYDGVAWERFGAEHGVPSGRVRCTLPLATGDVWVALERGVGVLRTGRYATLAELRTSSVRRMHLADDGTVWLCCDRGPDETSEGGLVRVHENEVRRFGAERHPALSAVFDLEVRADRLRLATAGGLWDLIDDEFVAVSPRPPGDAVFACVEGEAGSLLASTSTGLHQHDGARWRTLHPTPRMALLRAKDGVTFSFDPGSRTRFWRIETPGLAAASASILRGPTQVDDLAEAPDGALWAVGPDLLVRWGRSDTDLRFHRSYPPPVGEDRAGRVWFASAQQVGYRSANAWHDAPDLAEPVCVTGEGDVWTRTIDGTCLVRIRGDQRQRHAQALNPKARLRLVAGRRGVLVLEADPTGSITVRAWDAAASPPWRLPADAPSNLDEIVVADDAGSRFWLLTPTATGASLLRLDATGMRPAPLPAATWRRPLGLAVGANGHRWLMAAGEIWTQEGDATSWRAASGLGDRATWVTTLEGRIAVGARREDGLFRVSLAADGDWLDCPLPSGRPFHPAGTALLGGSGGRLVRVGRSATPQALPMPPVTDVLATLITRAGEIWVGTTDGAFHLRPDPRLHVVRVSAPRVRATEGETVWLPVSVQLPFRPRSATMLQSYSYRSKVDGGEWSAEAPLSGEIALEDLPAGSHLVEVEVQDVFGRVNLTPARMTVDIRPIALQGRRWFPWALAGIAVALLGLLAHAFVSRRRLRRRAHRLGEVIENRTRKIRVELQRRIEVEARLRVHNQVLTQLATGQAFDDALAVIVHDLEAQAPGWQCAVCSVGPRRELIFLAAPSLPDTFTQTLAGRHVQPGADPCSDALDRTDLCLEPDLAARAWGAPFAQLCASLPLGASCAQPILSSYHDVLGAICIFAAAPTEPTQAVLGALESAARMATLAIELRRGEQERRQLQAQMQEAQRLESLGLLAGGIAHDFNNLLTGILGHAGLARAEAAGRVPFDETLAQVELAAQRAASLCSQLLAYSGRGRFVVRPLDLSSLVREMTQMLRLSIAGKHELTLELPDDLPTVEGDATQIGQVVMNLLTNAREAIGDMPGAITIRTEAVQLAAEDLQRCVIGGHCEPGHYVSLEVRDTGMGMNEATLRSIFDPFFTTKFTGRGLGLAAVHGIVRGHAGAMAIESEPGAGSRFRMFLPASGKAAPATLPPPSTPAADGAGTNLVVDDERTVRNVIRSALESNGFDVVEASDGAEALEAFATHRGAIRLALLDLILPRLNGEEVLAHVRAHDASLPVILSSGFDVTDVAADLAHDHHTWFLKKPFGPSELLIAVRTALGVPAPADSAGPSTRP